MKKVAPYGTWQSPVTTQLMVTSNIGISEARLFDDAVYWLELRPQERGRNVIMRQADTREALIPEEYNCRTQVHEYGGASYLPTEVGVFFVNQADQQVYCADQGGVWQVTHAEGTRFADFAWCRQRQILLAIAEHHDAQLSEPSNSLVAIDIGNGAVVQLHEGEDFYASPSISPDGEQLCWLCWSHPNMPWDGTSLWVAPLHGNLEQGASLGAAQVVAGGDSESIFQPEWSPRSQLFFVSDKTNWWNLYRLGAGAIEPVCPMEAEFGRPQWQFGMTRYGFLDAQRIVTSVSRDGREQLSVLDVDNGALSPLARTHSSYDSLRTNGGKICYTAQSPVDFPALYVCGHDGGDEQLIVRSSTVTVDPASYSRGQPVTFPTGGSATAHGFFYPPASAEFDGPDGQLPPLLVMTHGGPTAATHDDLSLKVQFWTSRGFAVFDVNYRGSTGFGRAYRDALKGQWGVADVEDCDYGVRYLVERGLVDAERVAIRGGSAGGFTTLAALAFTDTFKAGASLYGVSDLTALATDTHKFESRYLDSLIGPWPQQKQLYESRSPINHAENIRSPVIFLQGLEDKIVPPNQAEMMVDALRRNGVVVAYIPFEGEQHGFRQSQTIERAFGAELYFYGEIFGFVPADEIEPVAFEP